MGSIAFHLGNIDYSDPQILECFERLLKYPLSYTTFANSIITMQNSKAIALLVQVQYCAIGLLSCMYFPAAPQIFCQY